MYQPECAAGNESGKRSRGMPAQTKALRLASNVRIPLWTFGFRPLRMIHFITEERVEERFARWFPAAAARLDCNKHRVDLRQLFGIVEAHHPSVIGFVVHV